MECVTPDVVFEMVGVHYAGPIYIKGFVRKPTNVKSYICVFVSLSVKAVHLKLISDLSTELLEMIHFSSRQAIVCLE